MADNPDSVKSRIPRIVHVAVSRSCNINCIMCPIDREVLKDKQRFISFEMFQKLFSEHSQFEFLNFVGSGEVFVCRDFPRILQYCFEKGFSAMGCTTNLQLIDREIAELMVKNGFRQITASIDGCNKETFERIRRGASFDRFIETVEYINSLKERFDSGGNPHFTFAMVAMNSNIHELPGLVRLASKLKVPDIYVARLHVSKESLLRESLFFHQEKYNHFYDEAMSVARDLNVSVVMPAKFGTKVERIRSVRDCRYPFENMYIDVDGVAYPCVCRVPWESFVGNINEQSVADIWNSERFNAFRAAFLSDNPPRQCLECTFSVLDPGKPESHMTVELADKVKKFRARAGAGAVKE